MLRGAELLLGGGSGGTLPLTSGILEIVCTRELSVSATYTVTSGSGKIDIDVAQIPSQEDMNAAELVSDTRNYDDAFAVHREGFRARPEDARHPGSSGGSDDKPRPHS